MFGFIKDKLKKVYTQFTQKAHALFSRKTIDEQTLKELEVLLLSADTRVQTTKKLIAQLKQQFYRGLDRATARATGAAAGRQQALLGLGARGVGRLNKKKRNLCQVPWPLPARRPIAFSSTATVRSVTLRQLYSFSMRRRPFCRMVFS